MCRNQKKFSWFCHFYTIVTIPLISKSQYRQFLICRHEFWLQYHEPETFASKPDIELMHQLDLGNAIERLAMDYFVASEMLTVDFQQEYISEQLYARSDIVLTEKYPHSRTLVEVKSGTAVTRDYLNDLAFQFVAAEMAGVPIDRLGVLHVNKPYIFDGVLDLQAWLVYVDVTDQVIDRLDQTRENIAAAINCLLGDEPKMALHLFCNKKRKCPAFQKYHPEWPSYSVFQISGIHQAGLRTLLEMGITDIKAVPDDFELPPKQRIQVEVARSGKPFIKKRSISDALETLQFPLYFLDYEALQYGIPMYPGTRPYQQMVFQWSLHILDDRHSEPRHLEFLSDGNALPAYAFAQALQDAIPADNGTVIVWNKDFETRRNIELGLMYPEFEPFLADLNTRVFDLMEIFRKQYYVHPAASGSYSIKRILPVFAPQHSYRDLEIGGGLLASIRWFEVITGKIPEKDKEQVMVDLRSYCHLDTLAMVEIYSALAKG